MTTVFNIFKTSLVSVVMMLVMSVSAFADELGGYPITISLVDATDGTPVGFATISISKKNSSKTVKYALSDSKGKAEIENVSNGTYILKAEMMGYIAYTKEVTVNGKPVDLGTVKMQIDQEVLDAASVSAVGNAILVKKDTIEYNASAFKTTENDMLEDLLKKLPGVEVDGSGSIKVNGETVSKITIDGKTFFLNDPTLATKNLSAKLINKIKVVEKKSEQAEFTGIDDGQRETVIDLSVQPGVMSGMAFGNVTGGVGHDLPQSGTGDSGDYRYQGNAFVGRFSENSQLSLIVNGGNTNNMGFTDRAGAAMGGMMGGGMFGGGMMGGGQGGMGGGFSMGGGGITTSYMTGLNGAFDLFDNKMQIGGDYVLNGSRNYLKSSSEQITFNKDNNLWNSTDGFSHNNTSGHSFGVRMEHKFSDNTSILFEPEINFGKGTYDQYSLTGVQRDDFGGYGYKKISDGFSNSFGDNHNVGVSGMFLLRQKLGLPGRTLSLNARYNLSTNKMNGFNQSNTTSYLYNTDYSDYSTMSSIINQRSLSTSNQQSLSTNLTYTEPLGAGFYLSAEYQFSWSRNVTDKKTYDITGYDMDSFQVGSSNFIGTDFIKTTGGVLNDTYTNNIVNRYINQSIGGNVMYQRQQTRFQIGFAARPTNTKNETYRLGKLTTYEDKVVNWSPQASVMWDMSDNANMRLFYRGNSSQPSTSQLMPVPDNTDPYNVSFGNPYLTPYFSHNMNADVRLTNKKTFMSTNLRVNGGFVQNPITTASWQGTQGTRYSMPVNGPTSANASVNAFINTPIAKSNFSVYNSLSASFNTSGSMVGNSRLVETDKFYKDGEFDYEGFHTYYLEDQQNGGKIFELNKTKTYNVSEQFRLTYRNDNLELQAGANTRFNKSTFTVSTSPDTKTWTNSLTGSAIYNWNTIGLGLNTDFRYNWYVGYATPQKDEYIWNASITKLLFGGNVTAGLKINDILNQAKTLNITDNSNYHMETRSNTLGRVVMFTLTFRFGSGGFGRGQRGGGMPPMGGGMPPMGGGAPMGGGRPPMM